MGDQLHQHTARRKVTPGVNHEDVTRARESSSAPDEKWILDLHACVHLTRIEIFGKKFRPWRLAASYVSSAPINASICAAMRPLIDVPPSRCENLFFSHEFAARGYGHRDVRGTRSTRRVKSALQLGTKLGDAQLR
jgi:succinylglutamate desuccinylase